MFVSDGCAVIIPFNSAKVSADYNKLVMSFVLAALNVVSWRLVVSTTCAVYFIAMQNEGRVVK